MICYSSKLPFTTNDVIIFSVMSAFLLIVEWQGFAKVGLGWGGNKLDSYLEGTNFRKGTGFQHLRPVAHFI